MGYLSVIVQSHSRPSFSAPPRARTDAFWRAITNPQAVAALKLTLGVSLAVVAINAVAGTTITWVAMRDRFRAKSFVNALIDLPFALPTIVAGLTLLALYGQKDPPVNIAYTHRDRVRAALRDASVRRPDGAARAARNRRRDGGGTLARRRPARRLSPDRLPEPAARDSLGDGAGFRSCRGRVRRRRPDLRGQPFRTEVASVSSSARSRATTSPVPRLSRSCCS